MTADFKPDLAKAETLRRRDHYWSDFAAGVADASKTVRLPEGSDLASLRRGAGRQPGDVPQMWRFYREFPDKPGTVTDRLRAEHHALVLFGFHQQSQHALMHVPGVSFGGAMRQLRAKDRYSEDALARRFTVAAAAPTIDGLAWLLRQSVVQLRHEDLGIDYDLLFDQLRSWRYPESRARTRRRWGQDYFWIVPEAKK
jgi:CRISPR system Cascade subunit CasB